MRWFGLIAILDWLTFVGCVDACLLVLLPGFSIRPSLGWIRKRQRLHYKPTGMVRAQFLWPPPRQVEKRGSRKVARASGSGVFGRRI